MSRIDDLIAEHCPEGVNFKRLGDIARIKNGRDRKSLDEGDISVYGSGGIIYSSWVGPRLMPTYPSGDENASHNAAICAD